MEHVRLESYNETKVCDILGIERQPILLTLIKDAYNIGWDAGFNLYTVGTSSWVKTIDNGIVTTLEEDKITFKKDDLILELSPV